VKESPAKILVIGPSWVGDMVMAQSLFITLKQQYPDSLIDVLAPGWSLALLERMPEVNQSISMPLGHGQFDLPGRFRLGRQLAQNQYDLAIVLPNSWKSALIPWFAGIPFRRGYVGECRWGLLNQAFRLNKRLLTMTVQRFVALGLPDSEALPPHYEVPRLSISQQQQQQIQQDFQLDRSKPVLALCPGAEYGPAKRWPIEHFAELARLVIREGWQVWLLGSEKDQAVAQQIAQDAGEYCRNFAGETSLGQAVDLLSLANQVVSNDSGLMHVAAALGKPLVALYGSSDPGFTPPLNAEARVLNRQLACSPCFKRECPLGHTECLSGITPEQVMAALGIQSL
jgi:heptosyltransferase-2